MFYLLQNSLSSYPLNSSKDLGLRSQNIHCYSSMSIFLAYLLQWKCWSTTTPLCPLLIAHRQGRLSNCGFLRKQWFCYLVVFFQQDSEKCRSWRCRVPEMYQSPQAAANCRVTSSALMSHVKTWCRGETLWIHMFLNLCVQYWIKADF